MLLDFGVADYGVRGTSDWTTDSVRYGVAGGQRLEKQVKRMYTDGCIREMRRNKRVEPGCVTSVRITVGVAEKDLNGELLSCEKVGGCRTEIGEGYVSGTNWHLAVSEQSFVLNLLVRKVCHSYQVAGKILGGVGRVGESVQLSVKMSIILLSQKPKYYLYLIDEGDLCQTMRCKDLLKECSDIVESSVIGQSFTLQSDRFHHIGETQEW